MVIQQADLDTQWPLFSKCPVSGKTLLFGKFPSLRVSLKQFYCGIIEDG